MRRQDTQSLLIGPRTAFNAQKASFLTTDTTICMLRDLTNEGRKTHIKLIIVVGLGRSFLVYCLARQGSSEGFTLLQCFRMFNVRPQGSPGTVLSSTCLYLTMALSVIYLFTVMIN